MRYTLNLDCKTHYVKKNGTVPLTLRISINGEHDYLNTGRHIKVTHYDQENKAIKSGINGHTKLTAFITRQKQLVDEIIEGFEKRSEVATLTKVKAEYAQQSGKVKSSSFYDYVNETIEWERQNTKISEKTFTLYASELKRLQKYRPNLSIHDFTETFLAEYRTHIVGELKLTHNTAFAAMSFIRKYVKKLFTAGKLSPYPFANFKIGAPETVPIDFLEPEQLTLLHDLYDNGKLKTVRPKKNRDYDSRGLEFGEKLQGILNYFLRACYTGLRHSDIKTLEPEHIQGRFIVKEMIKCREGRKKTVRIPIRKRLLSLLNDALDPKLESIIQDNGLTNMYLARIMEEAGINKHITFHCARHTFAIVSLLLGIKIEVVSDILGHSTLTMTQRYARVIDRLREQEMDKWNKLAKEEFENTGNHEINCPNCENTVVTFERGAMKLQKLPLECPHCSTSFLYNLKTSTSEVKDGFKMTA